MLAQMRTRGPDGMNLWTDAGVALGHALLATAMHARAERQPVQDPASTAVVALDARLDNRAELAKLLGLAGHPLEQLGDGAMALAAWRRWGTGFAERLRGDFAIALWDPRDRTLVLARDHVGAKPLYAWANDVGFYFASDENALRCVPGFRPRIRDSFLAYHFDNSLTHCDLTQPSLEGLELLAPGSVVTIRAGGTRSVHTYWEIGEPEPRHYRDEGEARERFREVFDRAVQLRLCADVPVGQLMSGGLDSAAITASVADSGGIDRLRPYSVVDSTDPDCPETLAIRELLRLGGPDPVLLEATTLGPACPLEALAREFWDHPHPIDNTMILVIALSRAARATGSRVMLHGGSGDMVNWTPTHYLRYFAQDRGWRATWREAGLASTRNTYVKGNSRIRLYTNALAQAVAPEPLLRARRLLRAAGAIVSHRGFNDAHPDLSRRQRMARRLLEQAWQAAPPRQSVCSLHANAIRGGYNNLQLGLLGFDRLGGRFGFEMRDPWAAPEVLEYFLTLPMEYRTRDGWTKWVVREGYPDRFGDVTRHRTDKRHLGRRVWATLSRHGTAEMDRALDAMGTSMEGTFNGPRITRRRRRYQQHGALADFIRLCEHGVISAYHAQCQTGEPSMSDSSMPQSERKPYAAPVLTTYGLVRDLTANGSQNGNENNSGQDPMTMINSDRRMKDNIVRIGTHPAGIGLYLFDYLPQFRHAGEGRQFGVMADEVAEVLPEAVSLGDDGYLRVDYARMGIHRTLQ